GVPIYPTLTPPQVAYILKDSGARALFTSDPTKVSEIASVVESCPTIEHVIVFEADDLAEPRLLTLGQLQARGDQVEKQQPRLFAELAAGSQPDDLATIIYTSGTTGEPKGVMLTHANMVSNVIDSSNHLEFGEKDSALSVLPLSHGFERQS